MTAMTKELEQKKPSKWYVLTACALGGAVAGYIGSDLITGGANGEPLLAVDWSQGAAVFVGTILLICLVIVGLGFTIPGLGIKMKMFEDREQWSDERGMMLLSALGCGAWAFALIILAVAEPMGWTGNWGVLAVLAGLSAVLIYTCWQILREYDELWQEVNADTCTYAMYLTLAIGGVWAALAHMEFVSALAPLDWITLLTVTSIAGAIMATQRRGMLDD